MIALPRLHRAPRPLRCVARRYHSPRPVRIVEHHVHPQGMGGPDTPDNLVGLCDTEHYAVHALLDLYLVAGGPPPWRVRRRYGRAVQRLAAEGYRRVMVHQYRTLGLVSS